MHATMNATDVRVHVASWNTADATELCIRTLRRTCRPEVELLVGDGGSTDGSIDRLRAFADRGWLQCEIASGGRSHAEWLDHWLAHCPRKYGVFVDSDVQLRRTGWLEELVDAACTSRAALVCGEMLEACPHAIEPVDRKELYLAQRPAPWMLLVDCDVVRELATSFAFAAWETAERPEGLIAFDTGGLLYRRVVDRGLTAVTLSKRFRRSYRHYGNLSWGGRAGWRARLRGIQLAAALRRERVRDWRAKPSFRT
jgi:glycosyltransferase involved in cell wall biosynthesis